MCTCEWPCYCAKIEITLQRQTQIMMHVCLCGREEEWIVPKIEINSLSSHFVSTNGCALNLTVSFLVWHWRVQTQLLPQGTRVTAKSPASLSIHLQILSVCLSLMFFIQTFSAPKDNAAIHHTTFKLMLIKPILHFSHVFPALLAKKKKKSTAEQNILGGSSFPWGSHMRSVADILWGILRYPCRLYCFICHQSITPSIVTTYDISCLAQLPSGSLVLPGTVQHTPTPALLEPVSLSASQTLSSIDSFIYLSLLCIE